MALFDLCRFAIEKPLRARDVNAGKFRTLGNRAAFVAPELLKTNRYRLAVRVRCGHPAAIETDDLATAYVSEWAFNASGQSCRLNHFRVRRFCRRDCAGRIIAKHFA